MKNKTELKTLKDLQNEYEWQWDTYSALKAEAVKWVKELSNVETEKDSLNWYLNSPLIEWIKHFFNITEEDLK